MINQHGGQTEKLKTVCTLRHKPKIKFIYSLSLANYSGILRYTRTMILQRQNQFWYRDHLY